MKTIKIKLTGTSPILLACDRLSDPLDKATIEHKKLTGVKKKTEDVHMAIAKSQYVNGLYYSQENGVHMPSVNVKKALEEGAKLSRNGDKVRKAVMILEDEIPLEYGKKLTPEQLWNDGCFLDKRSVVVSRARVMCYRPKFQKWSLSFDVAYDEGVIHKDDILDYFNQAGAYIGLGGFRPAKNGVFGRFQAEVLY